MCAEVKQTSVITKEEENALWEKGVLSVDTPKTLLRAVFYMILITMSTPSMALKIEVAVIISFVLKTRVFLYFHVLRLVSGVTLVFWTNTRVNCHQLPLKNTVFT